MTPIDTPPKKSFTQRQDQRVFDRVRELVEQGLVSVNEARVAANYKPLTFGEVIADYDDDGKLNLKTLDGAPAMPTEPVQAKPLVQEFIREIVFEDEK